MYCKAKSEVKSGGRGRLVEVDWVDVVKLEATKCRERWGLGSRDPGCQSGERVMERLELLGSLFMRNPGVLCLYSLTKSGACTKSADTHSSSLGGYPFHLIKNWSSLRLPEYR